LGNDCIPNSFLRVIGPKLTEVVVWLVNVYWALGYFLARFKEVRIVVLRKLGKLFYSNLGVW